MTRPRQRGVTLIELLVTIVILGFAVALMSGAFSQISHMLRISGEHNNAFLGRWTQSRALYDLTANLVIDPALERAFVGKADQVDLVSLAAPEVPWGVAHAVRLRVKRAGERGQRSEVWVEMNEPGMAGVLPAPLRVAEFDSSVEFGFVDNAGKEFAQWPPMGAVAFRALPSAVLLKETGGRQLLVRVATYEGNLNPSGGNAMRQAFSLGK